MTAFSVSHPITKRTQIKEMSQLLFSSLPDDHSLPDLLQIFRNRIHYLLKTGTWMTEKTCLHYCYQHNIEDLGQIVRLFNHTIAVRYPGFKANGIHPLTLEEKIQVIWTFIKRSMSDIDTVGAVFPSSKKLAHAIIKHIHKLDLRDSTPRRYLEIGAGTGAFTHHILERLKPTDHLDIVEIDPHLCAILRRKFGHMPNVTINELSILDFQSQKYDAIISGLPHNAFKASFVKEIFQKYLSLIKKGGHISYFEYKMPQSAPLIKKSEDRKELFKVLALKKKYKKQYGESQESVWLNLFPANVQHWHVRSTAPHLNRTILPTPKKIVVGQGSD